MKRPFVVLFFMTLSLLGLAQPDTARVMCYNLLNFPTFNLQGREDTLRKIINHVKPDLLLIQELKTDSGLQLIKHVSFADLDANYTTSTFVPQQSNALGGFKLQQAIVYNSDMLGLKEESYLLTGTRDINKFVMYYKDNDPMTASDTIFFHVFVTHFKSSTGTANEENRLEMAQTFTFHQQYLPPNTSVIFAGDLNLYSSNEPAYLELLDPNNTVVMKDPIESPGVWSNASFEPKQIHTQSSRASSIFGDGAGGGVDDRFDFILLSQDMMQPWGRMAYCAESYDALGNTGNCYNQSITDCQGGDYPDSLLSSLYFMSDHLPVLLDVAFNPGESLALRPTETAAERRAFPNPSHGIFSLNLPTDSRSQLSVTDAMGRTVLTTSASGRHSFDLSQQPVGLYLLRVRQSTAEWSLLLMKE